MEAERQEACGQAADAGAEEGKAHDTAADESVCGREGRGEKPDRQEEEERHGVVEGGEAGARDEEVGGVGAC